MATVQSKSVELQQQSSHRIGVLRLGAATAVAAAAIFVLCWLGTFIPLSNPTHSLIGLFTQAEMSSMRALADGTCWSLVFGGLSGALIGLLYNMFANLEPR